MGKEEVICWIYACAEGALEAVFENEFLQLTVEQSRAVVYDFIQVESDNVDYKESVGAGNLSKHAKRLLGKR